MAIEQENKVKVLHAGRVVMAFTSFVDHAVSIYTLIAAFLARTAIFAFVN